MEVSMAFDEDALARDIGKAISKRRLAASLTQEEVAELLGVGNEAVSRMERGTATPTVIRLMQLAEIFKCPVGDLLVETSYRADDQAKVIAQHISALSLSDRRLVVEFVEKLANRLNE
jgi:transcriptional regulator with XRE-family HTH domain